MAASTPLLCRRRGHKQAMRWLRQFRAWLLGRLMRDIRRKIAGDIVLERTFTVVLTGIEKLLDEKSGGDKPYALYAPEVDCVGKGKAQTL